MSLTNRNSGTHFLNLSAYNRFRSRLTSGRRSDSSISDAESMQSSEAEEQGPMVYGCLYCSRYYQKTLASLNFAGTTLTVLSCAQGSTGDCLPTQCTEGEILSSPNLKAFTFNELKRATRNFCPDSRIGEGAFGRVFRGWIDEQTFTASKPGVGMVVAVKKFKPEGFYGPNVWLTEFRYLGQLHHPNLVKLIGFCPDGDILVYEFMPKGSLANHLFRSPQSLSWATRIKVAIGAAKGLTSLHDAESQVIHRDVNSSNILLDSDFNAKLSGFGLAMTGPTGDMTDVFTRVMGSSGYIAPEYVATGRLSAKADVYNYGFVLLELLSGRRALELGMALPESGTEQNLLDWVMPYLGDEQKLFRIMDSKLEGQFPVKVAHAMAKLVSVCIRNDPKLRPRMSEVLAVLEQLQDREEIGNETAENLPNLNVHNFRLRYWQC